MIENEIIQKRLSPEQLKRVLAPENEDVSDKILKLRRRISSRIQQGREQNFDKAKIYRALDLAWEMPSKQITPTLLASIADVKLDDGKSTSKVQNILQNWGINMSDIIVPVDSKVPRGKQQINIPAFFNIFVPIMKGYVTIRWAKITNDRNREPFLEYEPAFSNPGMRARADAITGRVNSMTHQFGYFNVIKQCVYSMLHYGEALAFPMEEWYTEEQECTDKAFAKKNDKGEVEKDEKGRMFRVVREGIRYQIPPPTRTFSDQSHRPSTFNTNTGCSFGGYWRVIRFGEITDNEGFYNKDKITFGNSAWWAEGPATAFFNTVYPCQFSFPEIPTAGQDTDRETKMAENLYTADQTDAACVLVEYFERLIPAQWGLGDYHYPIWMRFVIAGDDTIVYAAPLPYDAIWWMGYDTDENRSNTNSLSLETMPFQDQFSNLLTQYLLTVKQNLANVTFIDTDVVKETFIDKLKNIGERLFRERNYFPFSGRLAQKSQHGVPHAFHSHNFPNLNTQDIVQAMKIILDIMERVLVMSAQEVGSAASHEQTKFEQQKIHESTGTRLGFTATPVDQAMEAMKQQLYHALMAYGSDDFYVEIPHDPILSKDRLTKMGFTWDDKASPRTPNNKITVKVKKSAISYLSFALRRDDIERRDNTETAMAILNTLNGLIAGPLGPSIGPEQGIKIVNLALKLAGFPRDFKLEDRSGGAPPPDQQQWILEQIEAAKMEIGQGIGQAVEQGIEVVAAGVNEHEEEINEIRRLLGVINEPIATDPNLAVAGVAEPAGVPVI